MRGFRKKVLEQKKETEVTPTLPSRMPEKVSKVSAKKHILKKDINLSMPKGTEVSDEKYGEMVAKGLGEWFE